MPPPITPITPPANPQAVGGNQPYRDIVVAVHGIGAQMRNATVRSVATRLARSTSLIKGNVRPLSPQPLGFFHKDVQDAVKVCPLDHLGIGREALAGVGVCEAYWADIPQSVVSEKRTLEETKAWARTVVARARSVYAEYRGKLDLEQQLQIREPDFGQAGEVLEEVIDTVEVLENLCFLADKAGIYRLDIREVLDEYLGDVQLVTEFTLYRHDVVGRFHRTMEEIHKQYPEARLHIVAHSEGTVVSFLGLLHAASGQQLCPAGEGKNPELKKLAAPPAWLKNVRGFMTIGSPIDKHILLWPELFKSFDLSRSKDVLKPGCIQWRNYYDYGDPVGFDLNTARDWLEAQPFNPFNFTKDHDIGFARYMLPGKAHNDYWEDPDVFEHFVRDVILEKPEEPEKPKEKPEKPKTRGRVYFLSPTIPYVASFLILFGGMLLFYRAVAQYIHPPLGSAETYSFYMTVGYPPVEGKPWYDLFRNTMAATLFIAGITLFSRLPRLAKDTRFYVWGGISFLLGAVAYRFIIEQDSAQAIGAFFALGLPASYAVDPTRGTLALGFVVALFGLLTVPRPGAVRRRLTRSVSPAMAVTGANTASVHGAAEAGHKPKLAPSPTRRTRWFRRGMRPLLVAGAGACLLLVGYQVVQRDKIAPSYLSPENRSIWVSKHAATNLVSESAVSQVKLERLAANQLDLIEKMIRPNPPVWPMLLSGAAFLYLWWLATLLFDLSFVWQRYIRQAVGSQKFREVARYSKRNAPPTKDDKI